MFRVLAIGSANAGYPVRQLLSVRLLCEVR